MNDIYRFTSEFDLWLAANGHSKLGEDERKRLHDAWTAGYRYGRSFSTVPQWEPGFYETHR